MNDKSVSDTELQKIIVLYFSQIEIPPSKPKEQFLLCPVGLVGAGKSTVVIPLSKRLNLVRVSHDEIREILKDQGFNYDRSKEIMVGIIKDFLEQGYSVSIDANCGSKETFETIKKVEAKYSLKLIWLHINPPEEFIVKKLKNFKHTWLFKNGDEAVKNYTDYKEKYGDGTNLGIHFTYQFDTSRPDIQEQLNRAEVLILKELS